MAPAFRFSCKSMSEGLVILTGGQKPWYQSGPPSSASGTDASGKAKPERKTGTRNRAAAKAGPKIVNPIFIESAKLIKDAFWIAILTDTAYGKDLPRPFRYSDGVLSVKVRSKTFTQNISQSDPALALTEMVEFMRLHGNIMSEADKETARQALNERLANTMEVKIDSWSKVKTSSHRCELVNRYVSRTGETSNLSKIMMDRMRTVIHLGINAGHFNTNTITVTDGVIESIEGLVQTADGFSISPAITIKGRKPARSRRATAEDEIVVEEAQSEPAVSLLKLWVKQLTRIEKTVSKYNARTTEEIPPTPSSVESEQLPIPPSTF